MISRVFGLCLVLLLAQVSWGWANEGINSGETTCGTFSSSNSFMDSYTFTGTMGEHVAIGLSESSGGTNYYKRINLYPPNGTSAEASTGGYNAYLATQLNQSGVYTIVVSDDGLNDTYNYCISFVQSSAAPSIRSDQTLGGTLTPSSVKAYLFHGTALEHVAIGFAESSGGHNFYKNIRLYPPDGEYVEASSGGYNAYLDTQLDQTGTYMIVLTDDYLNNSYGYNVSFAQSSGTRQITPGEKLSGTIVPGAVQAYRFYGQALEHVAIGFGESSGKTLFYKNIRLYPPNGGNAEASSGGDNAYLHTQLKETGTYMIVLTDDYLNDSYGYNVSLLRSSGPVNSPGDLNGALINPGQTCNGTLKPGYLDSYLFYGQTGDRVIIGFSEAAGAANYYKYISLYPPNGQYQEAYAGGYNTTMDHQLAETGLYMVVASDDYLNDTYDYSLSLVKIPSTAPPGIYSPVPANGTVNVPLRSSFSWSAVAEATGYDLYLATDMNKAPTKIAENLTANSMAFPWLFPDTLYYWRVIAHTPLQGDVLGPYNWFQTGSRSGGSNMPVLNLLLSD